MLKFRFNSALVSTFNSIITITGTRDNKKGFLIIVFRRKEKIIAFALPNKSARLLHPVEWIEIAASVPRHAQRCSKTRMKARL